MAILFSDATAFARLDELGFDQVQFKRNRGESLDVADEQVRRWLELRAYDRRAVLDELQRRSVEAAERVRQWSRARCARAYIATANQIS